MSLAWLLILPTAGAVAVSACPRGRQETAKVLFGLAAGLALAWAVVLLIAFEPAATPQWVLNVPWLATPWPVAFHFGVDGFNLFLVALTALFGLLSGIAFFGRETDLRGPLALLLLLEAATFGVFLSLDLVAFYIFWDLMLVPSFLLILGWGGPDRRRAAWRYILYNGAGGFVMLFAIVAIGSAGHGFDLAALSGGLLEGAGAADGGTLFRLDWGAWPVWAFLGLAFSFAVKTPLFPLHGWMPDTYRTAPIPIAAFLSGVQSKAGLYGLMRVALPLFPATLTAFAPVIAVLALCGVVYGALVALVQREAKGVVAYSSLSHLGLVAVAIVVLDPTALSGAVLQMVNHGLFAGGLFLILGMVEARSGDLAFGRLGGLVRGAPVLAAGFLIVAMAALGLPGLSGFAGEFLMLVGIAGKSLWYTAIALLAVIVAAAYMLRLYQGIMDGPAREAASPGWRDIDWRERLVLLPIVLFSIWLGVQPRPVTERVALAAGAVLEQLTSNAIAAGQAAPGPSLTGAEEEPPLTAAE